MTSLRRVAGRAALVVAAAVLIVAIGAAALAGWIAYAARAGVARNAGTVRVTGVLAPVRIIRDDRGIAHVRAANVHDLYFAQGYATGSDRLFQIDLTRRFVLGRLSEMLGAPLLAVDERQRTLDVAAIVARQYAALPGDQRAALSAFADGINAAARREPVPPEYRALLFAFAPWRPSDALVAGFATTLALADDWRSVIDRDRVISRLGPRAVDAFFSLTDPAYDTPTVGGAHARVPPLPALHAFAALRLSSEPNRASFATIAAERYDAIGSNEWVAGGARTASGRALLANDPHLDDGIPGIWHVVDLQAPGLHMAGATLAGIPGVVLGHNAHIAWGSTNGTVAAPRVFAETFTADAAATYYAGASARAATVRVERFHIRFGADARRRYLATRHGFVLEDHGVVRHAVQWYNTESASALGAFYALDRASSLAAAGAALAAYPGPVQNFVVADAGGKALYQLAGFIPRNADWGLRVRDGRSEAASAPAGITRGQLPHVDPSSALVVNNSNNLQYGAGYPYRLSPAYSPPYRAAEVAADLRARTRYTAEDFRAIAADTTSFAQRDLARMCIAALRKAGDDRAPALRDAFAALAGFDGHITSSSRGATVVQYFGEAATADLIASLMPPDVAGAYLRTGPAFVTLMRALRERPRGWFAHDDRDAFLRREFAALVARRGSAALTQPYGEAFPVVTKHPLAAFGIPWWNAPRRAGTGGRYAPAVQTPTFGQSFRAVWDVGNWDAGGIDIPLGESGEPGSAHYTDLRSRYVAHVLTPLPFSDAAVARAARATLVLEP